MATASTTARPTLTRTFVDPVVRLSRRVRYGVAGRIMFANSVMLVGIMVLTTSLLYLQLSQLNTKREQDLLRSAADSISLSLGAVEADEASSRDEFLAPSAHERLRTMLRTVVSEYDFDIASVVPIDYIRTTVPRLGEPAGGPCGEHRHRLLGRHPRRLARPARRLREHDPGPQRPLGRPLRRRRR